MFAGRNISAVFGRFVEELPTPEKAKAFDAKNGKRVRVPHAAYVHETGEFVQLNCCLSPWCDNFGKPALTGTGGNTRLADGYEVDVRPKGGKAHNPDIRIVRCIHCKKYTDIRSNRSVAELMCQFTRKYAPALFCERCSAEGLQADGTQNYEWSYATPVPSKHFTKGGSVKSGAARMKCRRCKKTMNIPRYEYLRGIGGLAKNPMLHLEDMHTAMFLTVSQFRRSHLVTDAWLPAVEDLDGKPENPRAGRRYYSSLARCHYLAVEWLSHYNNQIRYGAADLKKAGQAAADSVRTGKEEENKRKKRKKARQYPAIVGGEEDDGDVADAADLEVAEEEEAHEAVLPPGDLSWLGDCRDMPHVQSDTLSLSVRTPLENDQRQEMRLLLSVLAPSGYVLLATLDYSPLYSLAELQDLDGRAGFDEHPDWKIKEDRELCMRAHLQRGIDEVASKDKKTGGKTHAESFGDRGVLIRRPYHALAHFYALEKIVSGLQQDGTPDILLSQDGEPDTLAACLWAFRERISRGECHLIACKQPKKDKESKPLSRGGKSIAELRAELVADVAAKQLQWRNDMDANRDSDADTVRQKGREPAKDGLSWKNFYLLSQGRDGSLPRNKTWVTPNTLASISPEKAAAMLQKASLYDVDSVCNQMRQRLTGFMRGKKGAAKGALSYLSHWQNPHRIQQLADIFAFGKNCLALHSAHERFKPAAARLGLGRGDRHLIHYCAMPLNGKTLVRDKFYFYKKGNQESSKTKEKNHDKS